jgi:trans-aconitate methyltransferase
MSGGFFTSVVPDDGHEPPDIDINVAHQARVYDYWLGGKDNFAADRAVGDRALQANPDLAVAARVNRAFLGRAVRFLAEAGIRQFLDIGRKDDTPMSDGFFKSAVPDDRRPPDIDTSVAHQARVYDYLLGGKDNFAADRAVGEKIRQAQPNAAVGVRANRAFLGRAVRFLAEAGIRQFLDIGTGIPSVDNTHEVAQGVAPESRVVYVDNDPIVLAHARALLTSAPEGRTAYLDADANDPDTILARAAGTLDFSQPIAITLLSILQVIKDPYALTSRLVDAVPPGSYLAISIPASDIQPEAQAEVIRRVASDVPDVTITFRGHAEVTRFFDGLELLEPGVVPVNHWRPGPDGPDPAGELRAYAAIGRKQAETPAPASAVGGTTPSA